MKKIEVYEDFLKTDYYMYPVGEDAYEWDIKRRVDAYKDALLALKQTPRDQNSKEFDAIFFTMYLMRAGLQQKFDWLDDVIDVWGKPKEGFEFLDYEVSNVMTEKLQEKYIRPIREIDKEVGFVFESTPQDMAGETVWIYRLKGSIECKIPDSKEYEKREVDFSYPAVGLVEDKRYRRRKDEEISFKLATIPLYKGDLLLFPEDLPTLVDDVLKGEYLAYSHLHLGYLRWYIPSGWFIETDDEFGVWETTESAHKSYLNSIFLTQREHFEKYKDEIEETF